MKYGHSCEYVEAKTRRVLCRTVGDALMFFDRVMAAGVADVLEEAGAAFGTKSPLNSMSKLIKLSQLVAAAASARKVEVPPLLRRTVQVMHLRLSLGITSAD